MLSCKMNFRKKTALGLEECYKLRGIAVYRILFLIQVIYQGIILKSYRNIIKFYKLYRVKFKRVLLHKIMLFEDHLFT